jgi:ATP-dependent RNA helicase DeaD
MAEGSVWFRAAIGRQKKAEARWLLPMICRRGGIDKQDIGAIRILDTTTEFEISERAAESFAVKIRRPDKEDNIRIEPMTDAPEGRPPSQERSHTPRRENEEAGHSTRGNDKFRSKSGPKQHGKPHGESGFAKPAFRKKAKAKKNRHG